MGALLILQLILVVLFQHWPLGPPFLCSKHINFRRHRWKGESGEWWCRWRCCAATDATDALLDDDGSDVISGSSAGLAIKWRVNRIIKLYPAAFCWPKVLSIAAHFSKRLFFFTAHHRLSAVVLIVSDQWPFCSSSISSPHQRSINKSIKVEISNFPI